MEAKVAQVLAILVDRANKLWGRYSHPEASPMAQARALSERAGVIHAIKLITEYTEIAKFEDLVEKVNDEQQN